MEQLKKILFVCRQHYEKLILVITLLILAGAVWMLSRAKEEESQQVQQASQKVVRRPVIGVPLADLSHHEDLLKRAASPPSVVLSGKHNFANPVRWQTNRTDPSQIVRIRSEEESGPGRLQIKDVRPLNLTITLDRPSAGGFLMAVANETQKNPKPAGGFYKVNETNRPVFFIREVRAAEDKPVELVLELRNSGDPPVTGVVSTNQPFTHVLAYEVVLHYPVEKRDLPPLRVNGSFPLSGEEYKVVAITRNEVVVSPPSGRKYTIRNHAVPAPVSP